MTPTTPLFVLADGVLMGRLGQGVTVDALTFSYDPQWRLRADAFPLSLSLPLIEEHHATAHVAQFFRALLPDNPTVREAFAQQHQVSAADTFGLLAALGEDCPGAVQCVRSERVEMVTHGTLDGVRWLQPRDLRRRLASLRDTGMDAQRTGDAGQFSLAGAQAKTALLYDPAARRWGVPAGRVPTTHILKPAPSGDPRRADNEHICLILAASLGLPTAQSSVHRDSAGDTLLVARYDRVRVEDGSIVRLHQEDMCQALGIAPELKYEHRGGPSPQQIVGLLRERSADADRDIKAFLGALALNWVLYGTDAHGRNYSLLIGSAGRVQLAPLYDILSALAYPHILEHTINLSMLIGPTRHGKSIDASAWRALADQCGLPWTLVLAVLRQTVRGVDAALPGVMEWVCAEGTPPEFAADLARRIAKRTRRCIRLLRG